MARPATRLFAGTLVLALPLAAAAGCGVEKKRSIKQEFATAQDNLQNAKAVSLTIRLDDSKGNVAKLAKKDEDTKAAVVDDVIGSSLTYTFDGASDKKLKDLHVDGTSSGDLKTALKSVNVSFVIKDSKTTVGEIRLVAGTLYARADFDEITRVAKDGGEDTFDDDLESFVSGAPTDVQPALQDARKGKWLSLPLDSYVEKVQDLAKSFPTQGATASPDSKVDGQAVASDLFSAVKPFITVTDANDSSSNRVLNVDVKVGGAVKAALAKLKTEKGLPFASQLSETTDADIDDALSDGTAKGTITLKSGHLTQVTVDIDSIRKLDKDADSGGSLAGSKVVFDVDDSAGSVSAPTDDVSTVQVKDLLDGLLDDVTSGLLGSDEAAGSYAG